MRDCVCVSLIMEHIPIRGLVNLICEYSAEYSAERISDWLSNNGSTWVDSTARFTIRYELHDGQRRITFRDSNWGICIFRAEPRYVMKFLQNLGSTDLLLLKLTDMNVRKCARFANRIGYELENAVRPKCHYMDHYA